MRPARGSMDDDHPFDAPRTPGAPAPWFVVDDALTPDECDALVARVEALQPAPAPLTTARGFVMRPDVRDNDRVLFDDAALAATIYARVADGVARAALAALPAGPSTWRAFGCNERLRGYRYGVGQRFAPHADGAFVRGPDERSFLTVLVYLNDGCVGGETALIDDDFVVVPRRGAAFVFAHHLFHEGRPVRGGRKYALRTDVMYRR